MLPLPILTFVLWTVAAAKNHCSICLDHTMCQFGKEIGPNCGVNSDGGISKEEMERIVKLHNDYRSRIANGNESRGSPGPQPSAANMQSLVWDDKLAEVAQRWADQCDFQHDRCRDDFRFTVGQNIYWSSGKNEADWSRAVQAWYEEVIHFSNDSVSNYNFAADTVHYAQLASANTRYIGCGRRSYPGAYRLRGSGVLEYVLGDARNVNDSSRNDVQPNYFGAGNLNLTAGVQGAVTRKTGQAARSSTRDTRQEPGYFGGGTIDPAGTAGALTGAKRPLKPKPASQNIPGASFGINSGYNIVTYPAGIYWSPVGYYPYGRYTTYDFEGQRKRKDASSDISKGNEVKQAQNFEYPPTLLLSTLYEAGSKMEHYDLARNQILICNYGPSGLTANGPIYEQGTPCSKCLAQSNCHNGICM